MGDGGNVATREMITNGPTSHTHLRDDSDSESLTQQS